MNGEKQIPLSGRSRFIFKVEGDDADKEAFDQILNKDHVLKGMFWDFTIQCSKLASEIRKEKSAAPADTETAKK